MIKKTLILMLLYFICGGAFADDSLKVVNYTSQITLEDLESQIEELEAEFKDFKSESYNNLLNVVLWSLGIVLALAVTIIIAFVSSKKVKLKKGEIEKVSNEISKKATDLNTKFKEVYDDKLKNLASTLKAYSKEMSEGNTDKIDQNYKKIDEVIATLNGNIEQSTSTADARFGLLNDYVNDEIFKLEGRTKLSHKITLSNIDSLEKKIKENSSGIITSVLNLKDLMDAKDNIIEKDLNRKYLGLGRIINRIDAETLKSRKLYNEAIGKYIDALEIDIELEMFHYFRRRSYEIIECMEKSPTISSENKLLLEPVLLDKFEKDFPEQVKKIRKLIKEKPDKLF